ncbi:hypothetical protein [Rhizobacter sp. Root1221]|uniref:hypothetical protein n=1 Tax=Rhizobacter sp. Root1221 TaxID=1736433 RepID=UPI0006F763D1|nr:hypothetical protein [Rhizobacter sp. Root1221]KQV92869.1 hypothetical protein ASC87_27325 [Rhizobacter sp. Root1221]
MSIDPAAQAGQADPARSPTTARAPADPARLAWQREMERAQTETWFKKQTAPPPGPDARARGDGRPAQAPANPSIARTVAPPHPVFTWAPAQEAGQVAVDSAGHQGRALAGTAEFAAATASRPFAIGGPAAAPVPAPLNVRPSAPNLITGPAPTEAPAVLLQLADVAEPVRVHVQWDDGVARVWVGVDAAHADHLPRVAGMVTRWLAGQGIRVASLTCNGEPWPTDTAFFDSRRPDADAVIHITETTREF